MDFTLERNTRIIMLLLLVLVATQAAFTVLFNLGITGPRPLIWGLEVILFSLLAAFAGAALAQSGNYHVGWAAIAIAAVLNVIQVGMGLKLFGPFSGVAKEIEGIGPMTGAIVALSFMFYNAAKILLGLAAVVFGIAKKNAGSSALGGLTALVGVVAIVANALLIIFGRKGFLPPPIAGASGVAATLLLALCLMNINKDEQVT